MEGLKVNGELTVAMTDYSESAFTPSKHDLLAALNHEMRQNSSHGTRRVAWRGKDGLRGTDGMSGTERLRSTGCRPESDGRRTTTLGVDAGHSLDSRIQAVIEAEIRYWRDSAMQSLNDRRLIFKRLAAAQRFLDSHEYGACDFELRAIRNLAH